MEAQLFNLEDYVEINIKVLEMVANGQKPTDLFIPLDFIDGVELHGEEAFTMKVHNCVIKVHGKKNMKPKTFILR